MVSLLATLADRRSAIPCTSICFRDVINFLYFYDTLYDVYYKAKLLIKDVRSRDGDLLLLSLCSRVPGKVLA